MSSVTNAPPSGQSPAAAAQVAVVGAGLIGRAWALVFARGGVPVRAFDPQPRARAAVRAWIDETLADLAEFGLIDEPVQAIAARVTVCDRLEDALRDADYVQENIVEQLEPKQALFATLAQHTGERTVLASSSSYIPISAMTRGLPQADRCLIAHPVNPPHLVPLVEICPSKSTAGWAIDAAFALHAAVGQVPIRVKRELEGFILNRLQSALLAEAMRLIDRDCVSVEDLDKTLKDGLALRWSFMGPFETIDLNAPEGAADYFTRYSPTMQRLALELVGRWSAQAEQRVAQERRHALPATELAHRARWRDRRLMALLAHKRGQPR